MSLMPLCTVLCAVYINLYSDSLTQPCVTDSKAVSMSQYLKITHTCTVNSVHFDVGRIT